MSRSESIRLVAMLLGMVMVALGVGFWFAEANPEGVLLHSPGAGADAQAEHRNAFSFGASIGLLATCLVYSAVLFVIMIRAGRAQRRPGTWCYLLAVMIALGFGASYVLDSQFA